MKYLFSQLTALSLRFRAVTLVLVVLVSIAGIIAVTQLKQELIPSVQFPQTIVLAQASGMTSDEVLNVVTKRLEAALHGVNEIVNLKSTTTGAFGSVITARNNFGVNQVKLQAKIQAALDGVWLPLRQIQPPAGEDAQTFAHRLLGDMTPDVLIYLANDDPNFLFQLSPEVWQALPDATVKALLQYLAGQVQASAGQESALRRLVEQQIVPGLEAIPQVANVTVSGGQKLPGETTNEPQATNLPVDQPSLLLQLTPEVWQIASAKAGITGALNAQTAAQLAGTPVSVPSTPPALPSSWQMDHFKDASDLIEMSALTRTVGSLFNTFLDTGKIVGALGQTDDLTPDIITQMLAIQPSLVNYFKADQLVAMSDDVFAALPDDYIAGLDGITRDELAAKALARAITSKDAPLPPVDLPSAWRIQPPQLITFSFDDLPLATYSISGTGEALPAEQVNNTTSTDTQTVEATPEPTAEATAIVQNIPPGPALPPVFALIGLSQGMQLNTAADLLKLQLPENMAQQFGASHLSAAQFFNFLILLSDPSKLPAGSPSIPIPGGVTGLINQISPDVIQFVAQYDDTFLPSLSPEVYDAFSDQVLALPNVAPPLDTVWNNLANEPQFSGAPLRTAQDIVALDQGKASAALNEIDKDVPQRFAGYEVRLFNSLSTGTIRYFEVREPDFFKNLDPDVLQKLSPDVLKLVPDDVLAALPSATATKLRAIASGDQPSAAEQLASRYTTNVPPADPSAPPINSDWALVGNFYSVELNSADDFFRFFPDTAKFLNSLFDSPQGAAFAPKLFGGLTVDDINYMTKRDPNLMGNLRIEALQMLSPDVVTALPQNIQDRLKSGATPFVPTDKVTRTNGNPSLNVTVYKTHDANNVEAFHIVDDQLRQIASQSPSISVNVAFEQASFVEESISGVAREGGLGAIFAVIVILIFLSSGSWARGPRRTVGVIMVALFLVALAAVVLSTAGSTGGDLGKAFGQANVIVRALLIGGVLVGLIVMFYPGNLPYPSWRSTLVTAVSIPLSVLMAMALMRWLPGTVHNLFAGAEDSSPLAAFLLQLFPSSITLNIMTLSGLTVAIGRVVDDSIVVLENIFRHVQEGGDRQAAIIEGVRDVSVAIFSATVITVVVFLPLGLTGGIIGEFFLPFGLAVTYALLSSFVVAVTVVPVMAYFLLDSREISGEQESWLERLYRPTLRWALDSRSHRFVVLGIAVLSLVIGGALFATRPQAFLPSFGEPQITVSINLPAGTKIVDTNQQAVQLEQFVNTQLPADEIGTVQTTIGGGSGLESLILGDTSVSENVGQVTIAVTTQSHLDELTAQVRAKAEEIFGKDNVQVSAASLSEQGFGGFALVLSGPQDELEKINPDVIKTLDGVTGLTNVTSSLTATGGASSGAVSYIRIDQQSALSYTGELETENTLGVTAAAKSAVLAMPNLPSDVTVSEGFQSSQQTEGFASLGKAMGIAIVIVIVVLVITFGSLVHWFDIILSIIVAPVGAAVLLTLTNRVLGISAMIGLLMLIGIVVTNAVVLIDRVQSNQRERGMNTHDALIEAGNRRLRPILMTAVATICALIPLAIGLSEGAIIASELGTVVIGGLFSSTLLTLIVVPVAYILLDPLHKRISRRNNYSEIRCSKKGASCALRLGKGTARCAFTIFPEQLIQSTLALPSVRPC